MSVSADRNLRSTAPLPRLIYAKLDRALRAVQPIHVLGAPRTGKSVLVRTIVAQYGSQWIDCRAKDPTVGPLPPSRNGRVVLDHVDVFSGRHDRLLRWLERERCVDRVITVGREQVPWTAETVRVHPLCEAERAGTTPTFVARLFAAVFPPRAREATAAATLLARVVSGGFPEQGPSDVEGARQWLARYVDEYAPTVTRMAVDVWSIGDAPRVRASWIDAGLECAAAGVTKARLQRSPPLLEAALGTWLLCELTRQAQAEAEPTRVMYVGHDTEVPVVCVEDGRGHLAFVACVADDSRLLAARRALDACRQRAGVRFASAVALYPTERGSLWASRAFALPINILWEAH
jgi:hypothetical protein